ncbi:beta-defensin 114 [Enhydra lutris kenyoni]|uniref:Beta-defensin n=1 Tax=Enhydra lutris kenyoni TaxID=391180 RepID=A0A2Y9JYJ8_ENHLU|nr:beta-defensin 114 [Enhydra lutris kenyoni]
MKIIYYLLHFLCYVTFILPATCALVDPDRCTKKFGYCRRRCFKDEKQIDICLSPNKICCTESLLDED